MLILFINFNIILDLLIYLNYFYFYLFIKYFMHGSKQFIINNRLNFIILLTAKLLCTYSRNKFTFTTGL